MSEQVIIGVAILVVILVVTLAAIRKYPQVGPVLQLWAAFGTLTGAMATYFFTREQLKQQRSETEMFKTAFEASEQQKIGTGKQVWELAAKIKPAVQSQEYRQAWEKLQYLAGDLISREIPVYTGGLPSPSVSPSDRKYQQEVFPEESVTPTP